VAAAAADRTTSTETGWTATQPAAAAAAGTAECSGMDWREITSQNYTAKTTAIITVIIIINNNNF